MTWQPISKALKDNTAILAVLHKDIYPSIKPNRPDLEYMNGGIQVVIRHPGVYHHAGEDHDHGWNLAGPFGFGGIPDEWIAGWKPLDLHPDDE